MTSQNSTTEARQKTILVIDDEPDWLGTITDALGRIDSFLVAAVGGKKEAIQKLKNNKYDLVFINVLLRASFSDGWLADLTTILDEISKQNSHAIMITGVNHRNLKVMNIIFELREQYNKEIVLLLPKKEITTYKIREAAMQVLGKWASDIDKIEPSDSSKIKLEKPKAVNRNNITADILLTLNKDFPEKGFLNHYGDKIQMLIGGQEDRKIYASVELWNELWLREPGLPNIPLMQVLAKQEFSGEMYDAYRDHVSHSLSMYFLGLHLFSQNKLIWEAINNRFSEDAFLKAWKIASLFHDIGYAGDKGVDREDVYLQPLLKDIKTFNEFPVGVYLTARGVKFSKEDEDAISRSIGIFIPKTLTLNALERLPLPGKDENLLGLIEDIVIPTQLAQNGQKTPLQNYYNLGKNVKPNNRERFRDHGILSALILLHQFYYFDYYLKKAQSIPLPDRLDNEARSILENIVLGPATLQYEEPVKQAAAAMALHNVNVEIWDIDQTKVPPYSLSLNNYMITLQETPLAFLLALTDVLQCWDRPKRKYVNNPNELSLPNQNVRIRCENNIIYWSVMSDSSTKNKLVKPNQEIQNMSKYLSCTRGKPLGDLLKEEEWIE